MPEKTCILVVDDEESQRKSLSHILKKKGYLVETAGTGFEALEKARCKTINVALLDIKLPDTNGVDLIAPLKHINSEMAIIMVTGFASVENTVRSMNAGASGYLVKPFHHEEMLTKMQDLLERQVLIREKHLAEVALQESETKFKSVFEGASDAIFIMDGSVFLDCNHSTEAMFGCSRDQIIGHSPAEFSPDRQPDGRLSTESAKEKIDAALFGEPQFFEWVHLHYDHTQFNVDVSLSRIGLQGHYYVQAIVRDITERKRGDEFVRVLARMSDDAPASITVHDFEGNILYVNEETLRLHGYTREEYLAKRLEEIDVPESAYLIEQRMQQISDTGEANFDVKHFRKDGSSFPLHVDAKIVDWGGRKVLLSIATDLTERKRVEEIILMSEARLVQAQKTAHLGSWEWDPITGKVDWSDELCRLFEISPDTIRKGPSEVRAAIYERIHPDDLPRYKEAVARTVELNIPYAIDYRIQLPSGSERYIFAKGSHVIDEAGNIIRLVGTAIDITERKRAEDALKESEDRFRISIEKAPEAILLFDVNQDRYVDANSMAENLFGCSRQQLLDSGPHQFYKSDQPDNRPISETVDEHRRQVLAGETIKFERHIRNGRSEDLVLEIRLVMLQSAGHRLIRSSFLDITERKRADDALRQANKKLNLLSSITRHDINNQLTVQIGYLEILEDMPFNPTQNEYFLKVTNAAKRISAMIQFTKEYEDVGVHAPIWQDSRALVDTAAKQAPPGQVMVKNGLPSGTEVFADPLVVKVFYNLMDNAFRYGGKITTIRFSVLESGDFHMIVCEDDGNGVVAQDKEKIFERGFGKNTGMGLALSREILDITGITICEIGEPGKGARFEMAVPKGMWRTSLK